MQKARPQPLRASDCCVSCRFQVLFHSPSGVLFTFPSRYLCTIGFRFVFSLGRWSSQIPIGFHVSNGTWECLPFCTPRISSTGLSPSVVGRSRTLRLSACTKRVSNMRLRRHPATSLWQRMSAVTPQGFRLLPVRSPLLGQSRLISLTCGY